MNDSGWITPGSKKNKNNRNRNQNSNSSDGSASLFNRNARPSLSFPVSSSNASYNGIKKDEIVKKKGNLEVWMKNGVELGDLEETLNKRLKEESAKNKIELCGKIDDLWECIHLQFQRVLKQKYDFKSSDVLKAYIYDTFENCYHKDDNSLKKLSEKYSCHMKFYSINVRNNIIDYGKNETTCAKFLHIGARYFMPLISGKDGKKYDLTDDDRHILATMNVPKSKPKSNQKEVERQKSLMQGLLKNVEGLEKAQPPPELPIRDSKKRMYYDVIPLEQLDKDKSLKVCTLNLISAHSGEGLIIDTHNDSKLTRISLLNRKNCGFNAFQGDKVYVKINDKATSTGKVLGVIESYHKPINSLYLCKVCKHQGSLMKPLDNSFPKIHVDNEEGRRKYERDLKLNPKSKLENEQKSEETLNREASNYADNKYVTIFKMKLNQNRLIFVEPRVETFDPETCDNLFVVCYQYWDVSNMYPNGTVVAMLSTFDTFEDSLHLIMPICKVQPVHKNQRYSTEMSTIRKKVKEVKCNSYNLFPKGAMVFTIDNEETQDMDDALSYHIEDKVTVVGVHITDVTKYISAQHEIYRQARMRFATTYPPSCLNEKPIYLFDEDLSNNLFSLVPNEHRAVLSVMFYFTKNEDKRHVLKNVTFGETIICSKYKLSYKEVEGWITGVEEPTTDKEDLVIALKDCFEIAKQIRRTRLPDSYFVCQTRNDKPDFMFDDSSNARMLIEEFMLMANEHVAKRIYSKYPNMTLLRVQDRISDYEEWVEELFSHSNMNFTSSLRQCCNLLDVNRISENHLSLTVPLQFYEKFKENINGNLDLARNMLLYDTYFSDFHVFLTKWYVMSPPASYECSIEGSESNSHFSLQKALYTHFTSPARRFSDVIVHRLLKSTFDNAPTLHTLDAHEINEVCEIGNKKRRLNRCFEKLCAPYAIFEGLSSKYSFILDCACSHVTNDELHLVHPVLRSINCIKCLKFSHLSLEESPVQLKLNEVSTSCKFVWKKIIFSHNPSYSDSAQNKFIIDKHLYDARLPDTAYKLFGEIRKSYSSTENLEDKIKKLSTLFIKSNFNSKITSDSNSLADPIIEITVPISRMNTVRVQFCRHRTNGLQRIVPELYIATETLQLCMIHHEDPIMCFVPGGKLDLKHNDIILQFDTIKQYREYFTPLIHVESLMEILDEKSEFTLIDIPIRWILAKSVVTEKIEKFGVIELSDKFCTSKNIIFSDEKEKVIDRYEYAISEGLRQISGDLVCLRAKKNDWKNYWIGHGEVLNVCKVMDDDQVSKIIFFMLTHSSMDIFNKSQSCHSMTFSIDVHLRSVVSKRQMEAVSSTNEFMEQIILGYDLPRSLDYDSDGKFMDDIIDELMKHRIQYPNNNQQRAMRKALTEKLSLIWGPPGTGKTNIGCILAHAYCLKNKMRSNEGAVLYCGPSNDCVNLVAIEMQRKFGESCPKMLRIFGEQQELADFPLPGLFARKNKPLTGEMQQISLHFLIRETKEPSSKVLKEYDSRFEDIRNNSHSFNQADDVRKSVHEMIKMYRSVLKEAKLDLLKKEQYNMILCTTSVSATRIMENFKITQVIVDEAGMCKEPETLIPILSASSSVENVVLIGDHKQLRPIIKSNIAGKRGLQISMFERYQSLRHDLVTMLNFQYRMHPSICEFPSIYFYSSKLLTNVSSLWSGLQSDDIRKPMIYKQWNGVDYSCASPFYEQTLKQSNYNAIKNHEWPGQRSIRYQCFKPIHGFERYPERLVFIHIIGDETIQSISTSIGNENSRANEVEVRAVASVYKKLIERLQPPRLSPTFITVLTQYKLQESKLFNACKAILTAKKIKTDPNVKTVIRSQGSENDYIIFSTVRSLRNKDDIVTSPSPGWERQYLGFITDKNQVNVALTRAKKGLIIIGNRNLLSANKMWKDLINNLEQRGCVLNNVLDFLS